MVLAEVVIKAALVFGFTTFCWYYGGSFGALSYLFGLAVGGYLQRGRNDRKTIEA